jgi:hypothetical protein
LFYHPTAVEHGKFQTASCEAVANTGLKAGVKQHLEMELVVEMAELRQITHLFRKSYTPSHAPD